MDETNEHGNEKNETRSYGTKANIECTTHSISEHIRDPAAVAKKRQRGLTVLERLAEADASRRNRRRRASRVPLPSAASRRHELEPETNMAARRLEGAVGSASTRQEGGSQMQVRCSCSGAAARSCPRKTTGEA